jgi:hypothetical protein
MAPKKKPAPKKASKPVKKANNKKPAPKKPATKAAPKKAAKPAPKKAAPLKPAKVVAKKPAEKPVKPVEKKAPGHENKSLVSVKPQIKPIVKKEPPKPGKVVIPKTTTKSVKKYEPEFTKSVLDAQSMDPGAPVHRYSDGELVEFREIITKKLDADGKPPDHFYRSSRKSDDAY